MDQDWLQLSSLLDKCAILETGEIQKSSNIYKYLRTEEDVNSDLHFGYSSLLNNLFI